MLQWFPLWLHETKKTNWTFHNWEKEHWKTQKTSINIFHFPLHVVWSLTWWNSCCFFTWCFNAFLCGYMKRKRLSLTKLNIPYSLTEELHWKTPRNSKTIFSSPCPCCLESNLVKQLLFLHLMLQCFPLWLNETKKTNINLIEHSITEMNTEKPKKSQYKIFSSPSPYFLMEQLLFFHLMLQCFHLWLHETKATGIT